jgi:chromosome segregation ATPase
MDRDETQGRDDIVRQEQLSYCALTLFRNDAAKSDVFNVAGRVELSVAALASATVRRDEMVAQAESSLSRNTSETMRLFEKLNRFIEHTQSSDSERMAELERRCAALEHELEAKNAKLEVLAAENRGLTNTLNRTLIKADMEHEAMRAQVHESIEAHKLDFGALRGQLMSRIDSAVLQYHKPKFDSAVQDLKDHQERVTREVEEHTQRLQMVADSIGSTGSVAEARSMHTQIPPQLRTELGELSKDQLLNLVDSLSFEGGVVAGVAQAVARSDHRQTLTVF